ncbi:MULTISPECIES: DUF1995 family protein [unclassified Cyanobium]|uniref:DUF1995 family protein n=1 Tax=unclassified Cyanobium TaxID=2627006 RepID=UPI0020CBDA03|nr:MULTISPECIES: DUF1995 family protein [unclassified Cyanobium]MCP9858217.1 DUF1995 family protein [Cyanobium sp. Cruz-8H5]MCP9865599.1 DUF1995 family protein [Cyanobium sp. Cruz-8D1]
MLPADLRTAEAEAREALQAALASGSGGRWTVEFRFEGLRLLPVVLRLLEGLLAERPALRLLFPDAGATALARRDAPALADRIGSFSDQRRLQQQEPSRGVLLLVGASQADYELVEAVCGGHGDSVVLINSSLEDAAIGIGSVARQRRKGFLAGWRAAYALLPQSDRALRCAYPGEWELYRLDPDGYRLAGRFEQKPDAEQQELVLSGGQEPGLGSNLRALGQMIEDLRN